MSTTAPPDRGVLGRALGLVAVFAEAPARERTLTELARGSGVPLTTAHRLCAQLVAEGVLERAADGRYRVGLRLWELGMLAPRAHGLREVALPFLEDLYEVTHENVQLMVLDGPEVVVLERLRARDSVRLRGRTGGRLPVHATSGGLVLLAAADDDLVEAVVARGLTRYTEATITTEQRLREVLLQARRQGHLTLRDHLTAGSTSVSAPVVVHGSPVAAVSVVGAATEEAGRLVPAVLTTARVIGRTLSGRTPRGR